MRMHGDDFRQREIIQAKTISLTDLVSLGDIEGIMNLYKDLGDDAFMQQLLTPNSSQHTPLALALIRGDTAIVSLLFSLGENGKSKIDSLFAVNVVFNRLRLS